MIDEPNEGTPENDDGDATEAAQHDEGQDQQPKQAEENSSTLWDTEQHSDAPGPFGTGSPATPGSEGAEQDEDEGAND